MVDTCHVNMKLRLGTLFCLLLLSQISYAWIHNLKLQDDARPRITLTHLFGFLKDGILAVNVSLFSCSGMDWKKVNNQTFGFTLEMSKSPGLGGYMEGVQKCAFTSDRSAGSSAVIFNFDLQNKRLIVDRGDKDLQNLTIVATRRAKYLYEHSLAHGVIDVEVSKTKGSGNAGAAASATAGMTKKPDDTAGKGSAHNDEGTSDSSTSKDDMISGDEGPAPEKPDGVDKAFERVEDTSTNAPKDGDQRRRRRAAAEDSDTEADTAEAPSTKKLSTDVKSKKQKPKEDRILYLPLAHKQQDRVDVFQIYFLAHIKTDKEEGLYNLVFHNCHEKKCGAHLEIEIVQDNNGNYLSADEMPIPALYFFFSIVFFIMTCVWFSVLRKAKEGVYKIHYLMLVVVFFRGLSNLFHGVNMHRIQISGNHVDAWAILWYIVYLMRGAVMFVTVLLIGAGWAFIKHVFSDKEKKLFLIIIPMQILLNVAWVIMEESEEGYSSYNTWHAIFIGVDLLCCLIILFPVIWSIRHLQEASKTDGKAAINLNKLKLFRHFYILVVVYIYFTRIIGYLLQITLPFRYGWMKDLFEEVFLLFFFSLTGYKFRPTSDNPYLQVPQDSDDEEIEMEEVVSKSGATETVVRVNQGKANSRSSTTLSQRESSHEYD